MSLAPLSTFGNVMMLSLPGARSGCSVGSRLPRSFSVAPAWLTRDSRCAIDRNTTRQIGTRSWLTAVTTPIVGSRCACAYASACSLFIGIGIGAAPPVLGPPMPPPIAKHPVIAKIPAAHRTNRMIISYPFSRPDGCRRPVVAFGLECSRPANGHDPEDDGDPEGRDLRP